MSFTFRNLFSEEEGPPEDSPGESATDPNRELAAAGAEGVRPGGNPQGETAPPLPTQSFLVSELLALIPPAISAQSGIPMEKEIEVPLPADGGCDVALSTIYQICPELFAAEITPLNDSMVSLPAKLGSSEAAAVSTPSFSASAFAAPGGETARSAPAGGADSDNPFWSPEDSDVPQAASTGPVEKQGSAAGEPFASGFADDAAGSNPFAGGDAGSAPAQGDEATTSFAGFSGFGGEASGFSAPSDGAGEISGKAEPESELSDTGGPVSEGSESPAGDLPSFAENPFDSNESFSTLFSKQAEEDADIPFPGGEDAPKGDTDWGASLLAQAPKEGSPPQGLGEMMQGAGVSDESETESPEEELEDPLAGFGGGFDAFASGGTAPEKAEDAAGGEEEFSGFAGFAPAESEPEPEREPAGKQPVAEGSAPDAGFQNAFAGPVTEAAPEKEPSTEKEERADEGPPQKEVTMAVPSSQSISVDVGGVSADVKKASRESEPEVSEQPREEPKEEASLPASGAMPAITAGDAESDESLRDLEFRAIFSTDETFTLSKVARRVISLPGIQGCALATPTRIVQASRSEKSRLGDEAKEMIDTIRNLAKLTGLPEARSFTLHTDRGTVSIFLEGDCCLTVNHDSGNFEPGVKEKLILIARSIHKLTE